MIEVRQKDRERAASAINTYEGKERYAVMVRAGRRDGHPLCLAFAAHRQQAEDAILSAADKWLAAQYGLSPLVADIDRIRGIDAGGEG